MLRYTYIACLVNLDICIKSNICKIHLFSLIEHFDETEIVNIFMNSFYCVD